jgi:hypothetical protein
VFIRVIKSKATGRRYVYKAEAYRTPEGKNRQRLTERVGILEDLQAVEPGVLERLKTEARQAGAERRARVVDVRVDLDAPGDGARALNTGCQAVVAVLDALDAARAAREATRRAKTDVSCPGFCS